MRPEKRGPIPDVRPLTAGETELIAWLLHDAATPVAEYLLQLSGASVVSRCGCGCPTIDLAVDGIAAPLSSPSTILAEAEGTSPEGVAVGIILHGREGLISELEVYSKSGVDLAFSMPDTRAIRLY